MTPEDKQEFKEYIFQAIQSGKKETSDLADSIMRKIEPAVEKSIEKYVNGHIREVKDHLISQDKTLEYIQDEQVRIKDELMKYKPYLEGLASLSVSGKIILSIAVFLSGCIGAWFAFKELLK